MRTRSACQQRKHTKVCRHVSQFEGTHWRTLLLCDVEPCSPTGQSCLAASLTVSCGDLKRNKGGGRLAVILPPLVLHFRSQQPTQQCNVECQACCKAEQLNRRPRCCMHKTRCARVRCARVYVLESGMLESGVLEYMCLLCALLLGSSALQHPCPCRWMGAPSLW